MELWPLVLAGLAVHVVLFYSIFDVYFTSPLVHGMTSHVSQLPPPAKRLILFVADGMRADKFYAKSKNDEILAPHLRNIIENYGSWGISHTRVPTETRPGHVALAAGFYEDVSAVAKGWKENPVDFDSVFNESRNTWAWGSPDVLPMFSKGASGDHVYINCYSQEWEDFGGANSTRLDSWVFKRFREFLLTEAVANKTLYKQLHQDKIVFFLHLLGIDTHGHSHKPYSEAYLQNIKYVDHGVREMQQLLEEFYGHDGKTAYVLTADHGMTDWGSHGAGHPSETLTPLVAWGAGIHRPVTQQTCGSYKDSFCTDWELNHLRRKDVEQADIAPLMTYLIGAPFPKNSVGILPLEYLNISEWQKAEALYSNSLQILAQYEVKMNIVKSSSFKMLFRPYQELTETRKIQALRNLKALMKNGLYAKAIEESEHLIHSALAGLNYYQTYNRFFLGASIISGFLGWMAFILQLILKENWKRKLSIKRPYLTFQRVLFLFLGIMVISLLMFQHLPWTYYMYCLLPLPLWYKATQGIEVIWGCIKQVYNKKNIWSMIASVVANFIGLQILVLGFFYREVLSICLVAMALWPLTSHSGKLNKITVIGWCASCMLVAVFPLLPLVGYNSNRLLVLASGLTEFLVGAFLVYGQKRKVNRIWMIENGLVLVSTGVVMYTKYSIDNGHGLPLVCQILSWMMLGVCPCLPLLSKTNIEERLTSIGLAFFVLYQMLCITYEGFFLLALSMLLFFWLKIEQESSSIYHNQHFTNIEFTQNNILHHQNNHESRGVELADLRRAFLYIFLTLVGFFGTGNIASINSFDPASIYCFVTVFNPVTMGSLMMIKNLIPLLIVTCAFRGVHVISRVPTTCLFLLVLVMCDFMGLHFFFLVQDTGSWLDIGTSISHYVIVMSLIIFLMLLFLLSQILTTSQIFSRNNYQKNM